MQSDFLFDVENLPPHWIAIKKGWQENCSRLSEALVSLTTNDLGLHSLIMGSTGSGKTVLIQQMLARNAISNTSTIILDARGDLVNAALEIFAGHVPPERVVIFDLAETIRPFGYNPIHTKEDATFPVLSVLDAIAKESPSGIGVQTAETLKNALLLCAFNDKSITCLEDLFYNTDFRQSLYPQSSHSVRVFWENYDKASLERQVTSLAMPCLNKISLLLAPKAVQRCLDSEPVDLGRHLNMPGSVLLCSCRIDQTSGAGKMFGSMLVSSICREVFARISIPESRRNPVHLIVDEFHNFSTHDFEKILAEGRKFRLFLTVATQVMAQLDTRIRSLILNGVGCKVILRTGREDGLVLSRDLTGDAKAIDFNSFAQGQAVLWRRGQELIEIEINEPIVADPGSLSPEAQAFRSAIFARQPFYVDKSVESSQAVAQQSQPRPNRRVSLENWL